MVILMQDDTEKLANNQLSLDVVMIRSEECLSCIHLCGSYGKKKYDCINKRGCPANFYQITRGIDLLSVSADLAQAWHEGDMAKMNKITRDMENLHGAIHKKVIQLAKAKLKELV